MDVYHGNCFLIKAFFRSKAVLISCLLLLFCGGGGGGNGDNGGDNSNAQTRPSGTNSTPNDLYGRIYFTETKSFPVNEGGLVKMDLPSGLVTKVNGNYTAFFEVSNEESFFATLSGTGKSNINYRNFSGSQAHPEVDLDEAHIAYPIRLSFDDQYFAAIASVDAGYSIAIFKIGPEKPSDQLILDL